MDQGDVGHGRNSAGIQHNRGQETACLAKAQRDRDKLARLTTDLGDNERRLARLREEMPADLPSEADCFAQLAEAGRRSVYNAVTDVQSRLRDVEREVRRIERFEPLADEEFSILETKAAAAPQSWHSARQAACDSAHASDEDSARSFRQLASDLDAALSGVPAGECGEELHVRCNQVPTDGFPSMRSVPYLSGGNVRDGDVGGMSEGRKRRAGVAIARAIANLVGSGPLMIDELDKQQDYESVASVVGTFSASNGPVSGPGSLWPARTCMGSCCPRLGQELS